MNLFEIYQLALPLAGVAVISGCLVWLVRLGRSLPENSEDRP